MQPPFLTATGERAMYIDRRAALKSTLAAGLAASATVLSGDAARLLAVPLPPDFTKAPFLDVVNRSQAVRVALEKQLNKKAAEITLADLKQVTQLVLPHLHPKAKCFKDDDFSGLSNLKKLTMMSMFHNRGLAEAPIALSRKVFRHLGRLEQLSITRDQLGQLPDDVFADLSSLTVLDLSHVSLSRLPRSLLKIETVHFEGRGMSKEDFETLKSNLGDRLKGNRAR